MDETSWSGSTGEVKDSSDNTNHGTALGDSDVVNDPIRGKVGHFDGDGDMVRIPHDPSISSNTQGITITAWINPTEIDGVSRIVTKKWEWYLHLSQLGTLGFSISGRMPQFYLHWQEKIPLNTWTHVAATWDGATSKLFINGTMVISAAFSDTMSQFGNDVYIAESYDEKRYFDGYIDEVMVSSLMQDPIIMNLRGMISHT